MKSQIGAIKLGFNARFFEEWCRSRGWPLDCPTVFEAVRTLDPAPVASFNQTAIDEFRATFPALAAFRVEQEWAGYIDVTPDAVPVISNVGRVQADGRHRGKRHAAGESARVPPVPLLRWQQDRDRRRLLRRCERKAKTHANIIEDEKFARKIGVSGVPFAVLSRNAVSGSYPPPSIALRGAAPIQHFEAAIEQLFPDGFPTA